MAANSFTYWNEIWETNVEVGNNRSIIHCKVHLKANGRGWQSSRSFSGNVNIGGNNHSFSWSPGNGSFPYASYNERVIAEFSDWIGHGQDGSLSVGVSSSYSTSGGYSPGYCSDSDTFYGTKIPRQANITGAESFNDEQSPTIWYSNPAGGYASGLDTCISWTGGDDIKYRALDKNGSSYKYNFTDAERETLRKACDGANSKTMRFYVRTEIGGNTFYSTTDRTLTIINANPTINPTVVDTNQTIINLTGNANTLVRYESNAKAIMNFKLFKNAGIKEETITNSGKVIRFFGDVYTSKSSYSESQCLDYSNRNGNVGWGDGEIIGNKDSSWSVGKIITFIIPCTNGKFYVSKQKVASRTSLTPLKEYKILDKIDNIPYTFEKINSNKFEFYFKDTRGNTVTKTVEKTMVNYLMPTCNITAKNPILDAGTNTARTTIRFQGDCFKGSFGKVSNTALLQYRRKTGYGDYGAWETIPVTIRDDNTYDTEIQVKGLSYKDSYTFQARITDKLHTVESKEKRVKTTPIFEWDDDTFNVNGSLCVNGSPIGDGLPIGAMIPFGSENNVPTNWRICDGSAVSRTAYKQLFEVIGTSYGAGDGSTTFNLPDKRGRVSVGKDGSTEFNKVGAKGGEKTHRLTEAEMPNHYHWANFGGKIVDLRNSPTTLANSASLITGQGGPYYTDLTTTSSGGSDVHNNIQPYEVDIWIIKVSNNDSDLINKTEGKIIDNLTSTSTTDALSANMGKELNEKVKIFSNIVYTGSQVVYDYLHGIGNTLTTISGAYENRLIKGIFPPIEVPSGYSKAYRITFEGSTSGSSEISVILNNIETSKVCTWSGDTFRETAGSRIFKESEIVFEPTFNYQSKGMNLKYRISNSNGDSWNIWNITIHSYLVK